MNKKRVWGCLIALWVGRLLAAPLDRPNIIVVLADDMGFSDISCFGGEIPTPNLDRLASGGLRFTQFYNTARCCPTRAALLTGLYSHEAGVGNMTRDKGPNHPGYRGFLNDRCVTIAEVLHEAGYFTAMTGKWHVGSKPEQWPRQRGFERFYGSLAGGFYFRDSKRVHVIRDDQPLKREELPKDWYCTDAWTEEGLRFIDEALTAKKPFFLYLAHIAPHFPLQAPAEDVARWRGKYMVGWDKLREARYQRQLEMGLIDKTWPLSKRPAEVKPWDELAPEQKDRFDKMMAAYAAVIERLDRSVGTLVDGLKKRGVLDNTLLLFISDNGGNGEGGVDGRFEGTGSGPESTIWIGLSWATLANTPFLRSKQHTHEGGVASPCIAHWPVGLPAARNGQFETQIAHVIDLMPTFVDLAKASYPKEFKGKPVLPMEGISLVPTFAGKTLSRKQPIFFEHVGNRGARDGDWKLVAERDEPWQLYNLRLDRTEQNDLSRQEPERFKQMLAAYTAWTARANVEPFRKGEAIDGDEAAADTTEKSGSKAKRSAKKRAKQGQ